MKPKHWVTQVAATTVFISLGAFQAAGSRAADDDAAARLQALQRQRRDTLQQLVKVAEVQYRSGLCTIDTLIRASDQLLDAELALAKDRDARRAILKQRVELLADFEKIATQLFQAGQGSQEGVLAAQAARLGAQIALLQAQEAVR